jgi:hypothetical protein
MTGNEFAWRNNQTIKNRKRAFAAAVCRYAVYRPFHMRKLGNRATHAGRFHDCVHLQCFGCGTFLSARCHETSGDDSERDYAG